MLTLRNRNGRTLFIEVNPYQTLVLGINRPRRGPVVIEFAAEFDRDNVAALRLWLEGKKEYHRRWMSVVCSFVARYGIIQRESLKASDLEDPEQLLASIREAQMRRAGGSTAPFQHLDAGQWTFRAINAMDGIELGSAATTARPALLLGMPNEELHEVQQHLLDCRLMPQQLEPSLPPLFGSLYQIMEQRHYPRAAVIFVVRHESTTVYILGKEGVHTPGPIAQGLLSIVQQTRREFALENDAEALRRLMTPDEELRKRARKLVRGLGAELRPLIDSYEMTTGQPVGDVYCAYLPPALQWLAEPIAQAAGHELLAIDCNEWMSTAGMEAGPEVSPLASHWLGALSLASNLPDAGARRTDLGRNPRTPYERSWHVDCRRSMELPQSRFANRGLLAGVGSFLLMAAVIGLTVWQLKITFTLQTDMRRWENEMASNQKLVDQLSSDLNRLQTSTTRINGAHALMHQSYELTELVMELGRILPQRMRLDRIESADGRIVLAGSLLEPAEDASRSLGRYLDALRRNALIGPLCTSISATSLQREGDSDALSFQISMRLLPAPAKP